MLLWRPVHRHQWAGMQIGAWCPLTTWADPSRAEDTRGERGGWRGTWMPRGGTTVRGGEPAARSPPEAPPPVLAAGAPFSAPGSVTHAEPTSRVGARFCCRHRELSGWLACGQVKGRAVLPSSGV